MNSKIFGGVGSALVTVLIILGVAGKFMRAYRIFNRDSNRETSQRAESSGGFFGASRAERQFLKKIETIKSSTLSSPEREKPYLTRRTGFRTQLTRQGKSPQNIEPEQLPRDLQQVTYPSGGLNLNAALYVPPNVGKTKRPALVYFHGGFAMSYEEMADCQPFLKDDFIIMLPALRGENNGDGNYELFAGELDDAANAIRWLSRHENVDAENIYAFGHSIGGGVAAMMSLMDEDLPLKHCGSSGGLYGVDMFYGWRHADEDGANIVRFDPENTSECLMRVLQGNVKWMKRKHYAYIGYEDTPFLVTVEEMRSESLSAPDKMLLNISQLGGDHLSSLSPAVSRYHSVVKSGLQITTLPAGTQKNVIARKEPAQSGEQAAAPASSETGFGSSLFTRNPKPPKNVVASQKTEEGRIMTNSATDTGTSATKQGPPDSATSRKTAGTPQPKKENRQEITKNNNRHEINRDEEELGHKFGDEFSEAVPDHGYLVGFEVSMDQRGENSDPYLVSVQPLYRARDGEKQGKGKLHGTKSDRVARAFAPQGYAVGGLRGQALGQVDGFELVFMKIREDGTLDPDKTQISPWIGGLSDSPFFGVIDGQGKHIFGVSGSIFMKAVHSLKLEFNDSE